MTQRQNVMAVVEFGKPLEHVALDMPIPQGDQVLIKTTYAGMCHSDLHQIDGYFNLGGDAKIDLSATGRKMPFCVGHEIEGEVVAVGPGAKGKVNIGQSYAVYPWGGCQKCSCCAQGTQNICEKPHANDLGNGKNMVGGYSSHVLVPTYTYCFDKTGIPDGMAATYMCAGLTAFSAVKKVGIPFNGAKDVLIIGLGGVGMQGFQMAKAMLGGPPLVSDIRQEALDVCSAQGAAAFNAADPEIAKKIKASTPDGTGIYATIDFVGSDKSFALSRSVLRRGGMAIQIGLLGGAMQMPLVMFPFRALQIKGSMVGSLPECEEMFKLLRTGKVGEIPYHIRSITEVNEAFDDMRAGKIVGRCILKHDWAEAKPKL